MILTYKIKHGRDFSDELRKAKKVAKFAIQNRSRSSKDVKHISLKSMIANQILKKYSNDSRAEKVKSVKLAIPHQGIKVDRDTRTIYAPCLKLSLKYDFPDNFEKVNQVEIGKEYAYISVSIPEPEIVEPKSWLGVDRNTTGHIAVVADPETGKGIKLEDLTGFRNSKKHAQSFRYAKHSWYFYQLQQMIEYKAKLLGVEVAYVEPAYTSKCCSRCGHIGIRNGKIFKCPACGHVDHTDRNAGFNIAKRPCIDRLHTDRDVCKGTTDSPKVALARIPLTTEPQVL